MEGRATLKRGAMIRVEGLRIPFQVSEDRGAIVVVSEHGLRIHAFRRERIGRLCGGCTTAHDLGGRIPRSCRNCDALREGSE